MYVKFYLLLYKNNRIMNLQIFPNWCKKLGVIIFVIFSVLSGFDDFLLGYNEGVKDAALQLDETSIKTYNETPFTDYFGEKTILLFSTLSLVGMLIYMLSKENIEDDFINKLRLESYQLAFIIITFITLILYIFGFSLDISVDTVIFLLIVSYLIIFAIKKRTV